MPSFSLSAKWHTPCYEKLSALTWTSGFSIASHGVKIGVRTSDPSLIPVLKDSLPTSCELCDAQAVDTVLSIVLGGRDEKTRTRRFHLVYCNHSVFSRSHRFEEIIDGFKSCLAVNLATLARRRVFIHAGAVGWQGKAIVFPGKSYSGKSTLVLELIKAGASYLSDEFAVLDFKGRVHPYPKPISLRKAANGKQMDVSITSIGGKMAAAPLPLGLVVDTRFQPNALWLPRTLSPGEGLLSLLANCAAARYAPERCLRAMERASENAHFIASLREEAASVVPEILDLMRAETEADDFAGVVRGSAESAHSLGL
ncbi:MAG: hypothetical protein AAF412_05570 [Pseudomonadota bacterium]